MSETTRLLPRRRFFSIKNRPRSSGAPNGLGANLKASRDAWNRTQLWVALIVVASSIFAGCQTREAAGPVPVLDVERATAAGLSAEDVANASKLYVTKCARCHKFYDPVGYDEKEWRTWMRKMSKKAKLQPDQETLLSQYLGAFRTKKPMGEK